MTRVLPGRLLAGVVTIAMLAAACSNGGTDTSTSRSPEVGGLSVDNLSTATQTIVTDYGDEAGLAVLLLAIDAGYTIGQIVDQAAGLGETGSIEGVEPTGPPLGLLTDPPASAGASALPVIMAVAVMAGPSDWNSSDTYIDFIDNTVGDLFHAADSRLQEVRAGEEAAEEFELAVTTAAAGLLARGYSPEQVIEALMFREVRYTTLFCWQIEPPVTPPGADQLSEDCAAVPLPSAVTTTTPTTQPPEEPTEEEASGDGARFVGAVGDEAVGSGSDVLINSVDLVAGSDLTGVIELLGNAFVEGVEDSEGFCFYLRIDVEDGLVPQIEDGSYQGAVDVVGGLGDGPCPDGPPDIPFESVSATLTARIEGDTLTGEVVGEDEAPLVFAATRQG